MFPALMSFLILQRIGELILAARNRRWALARGGRESGPSHYRVIVALHVVFYLSLLLEWRFLSQGWNLLWPMWLAVLAAVQFLRIWAILSLGRRWNTRIIVVPHLPPVTRGPYRFIRHPNYLAVCVELLVIPALCGAYFTATAFTLANAFLLRRRIIEEERALKQIGGGEDLPSARFIPAFGRRPYSENEPQTTPTIVKHRPASDDPHRPATGVGRDPAP